MFKRKKKGPLVLLLASEITSWDIGREWLKENGWLVHMYDNEYKQSESYFWAEKRINGMKVEVKVTAMSDLGGIKGLVEMAQKYEIRKKK